MKKIFKFIKSAKAELDKVKWPTKKQAIKLTKTVIMASLAVAVFLGMLDFIFNNTQN